MQQIITNQYKAEKTLWKQKFQELVKEKKNQLQ